MPIPERLWLFIWKDYIDKLPLSERDDVVFVLDRVINGNLHYDKDNGS
jgi:hypothetical protein